MMTKRVWFALVIVAGLLLPWNAAAQEPAQGNFPNRADDSPAMQMSNAQPGGIWHTYINRNYVQGVAL